MSSLGTWDIGSTYSHDKPNMPKIGIIKETYGDSFV